MIRSKHVVRGVYWIFILTLFVLGIIFFKNVFPLFLAAMIVSYLLNPLISILEQKGVPRSFSIILVYLVILGVLVIASITFVPVVYDQVLQLSNTVSDVFSDSTGESIFSKIPYFDKLSDFVQKIESKFPFINFDDAKKDTLDFVTKSVSDLPKRVLGLLSNFFSILTFIITIPLISFFLLKDYESMKKYFMRLVPNRYFELTIIILEKTDEIIGTYLRALMIEIFIVSILSSIALQCIGVPYALLIGILAGFANAIPYLGPVIGMGLAIISVLFTGNSFSMAIYSVIAMILVQFLDNSFIYPIVIGKNTEMHPLVIMLTVIAGGYVFGILGMLISVPLVFLVRGITQVLYKNLKGFGII